VVAVNHIIADKLPTEITNPIPKPLPFTVPSPLAILRRCTLHLSDPSQNARINSLGAVYDILALRPITEKSLAQACQSLECDIISLDLTTRFPFYFRQKTLSSALQRGIKIEICYAPAILESDGQARRNLISNATQLIRATRGKGLVISSEARRALSLRSPGDVINLACVWGLGQERGVEAVGREVRSAVVQAGMKRTGFRGFLDVVYGGEKPVEVEKPVKDGNKTSNSKNKRKAIVLDDEIDPSREKPISKREQKRRAKKARDESAALENGENKEASLSSNITAPKAQIDEPKTNGK